jgi:hypothetical protein
VPWWQRLGGKYVLLPAFGFRLTWDGSAELLERQGRQLIDMAGDREEARLTERVLVPPQIGLEDSSRYYSYAMVLEHLTITGLGVARIVSELTHLRPPSGAVRTAALKPAGGLSLEETVAGYEAMLGEFRRLTIDEAGDRGTPLRFEHPWFGALPAGRWMHFAPFHQTIHLKQARRILASLPAASPGFSPG